MTDIIITGAASAASLTADLRPLDETEPRRVVAIVYNLATGELTATAHEGLDNLPRRDTLPEGQLLICNAFAPLTEDDLIDLTERAVAVYRVRRAREEAQQ